MKAKPRPARVHHEPAIPAEITELPDMTDEVFHNICHHFKLRLHEKRDAQAIWQLAWEQRKLPLGNFTEHMRAIVLDARSAARPRYKPTGNAVANPQKYGSDEDSWAVFNG